MLMNQKSANVFIFVALECEAKALISQYKLKKENTSHPFSVYSNENIILTVTGVGKVAMASGVAYVMAGFSAIEMPVMINIGIAGHKRETLGSLFVASKVVDVESNKVFYPHLIGNNWPKSSEVKSSTLPNTYYSENCLNDMEASAFYETAVRFSSSELIHCLKVVSDNEESTIEGINAKIVVEWLALHVDKIEQIFEYLQQLRTSVVPDELQEYTKIVNQWHFSVSGKVRLKALLRRWSVLSSEQWLKNEGVGYENGKDILRKLAVDVDKMDVNL